MIYTCSSTSIYEYWTTQKEHLILLPLDNANVVRKKKNTQDNITQSTTILNGCGVYVSDDAFFLVVGVERGHHARHEHVVDELQETWPTHQPKQNIARRLATKAMLTEGK